MKKRISTPVDVLNALLADRQVLGQRRVGVDQAERLIRIGQDDAGRLLELQDRLIPSEVLPAWRAPGRHRRTGSARTGPAIVIDCSTLNSRLLLPPSTRPVIGSVGPMLRMSNPRTLYSPPRNSFSKIGSGAAP